MALEHRLEIKLLQKLILTPQLQMAIKLLQMPQLELSQTISNELMENPLLEETTEDGGDEIENKEIEKPEDIEEAELSLEKLMMNAVDDYFEERGMDGRDLGYFTTGHVITPSFEHFASKEPDLYDYLSWQLRFSSSPQEMKGIGEIVIGNIDDNGYLRATTQEIVKTANSSEEQAESAIRLIQTFDPPGVGARDLSECLLIQLKRLNLSGGITSTPYDLAEKIIISNLKDLEKKRYKQIANQYGYSIDEVLNAVRLISSFEPKPGRNFAKSPPGYIVPEVFITKTEDDYLITLNDESMPSLRISSYYRKLLLQKNSLPKEERQYLEERLRSAVWLLKSLDHRNKTIYRVSESILKFQRQFFDNGSPYLKHMNLKDVAEDLGMHESTISRATSNKYLSCSHGIFSFRFFFSSGINSNTGKVSSTAVKELIKKIISEESTTKPLSDQKIVELLRQQDIIVARRTVAKYREVLHIAPQMQRKSAP